MPISDKEPCHQCGTDLPSNWPMNFCNGSCAKKFARVQKLKRMQTASMFSKLNQLTLEAVDQQSREIEEQLRENQLRLAQARVEHGRYVTRLEDKSGRMVMGNGLRFFDAMKSAIEAYRNTLVLLIGLIFSTGCTVHTYSHSGAYIAEPYYGYGYYQPTTYYGYRAEVAVTPTWVRENPPSTRYVSTARPMAYQCVNLNPNVCRARGW